VRWAVLLLVIALAVSQTDWDDSGTLITDPTGDASARGPDLSGLRTRIEGGRLLVRIEATGPFHQANVIELVLNTDGDEGREYSINVAPDGTIRLFDEEPLLKELDAIGTEAHLDGSDVLEVSISLEAIGNPLSVVVGVVAYEVAGASGPSDRLFPDVWQFTPSPAPPPDGTARTLAGLRQEALTILLFAGLVLSLVRLRRPMASTFAHVERPIIAALWAVCALALLIRVAPWIGPFTPRVFMDEWGYSEGARFILVEGKHDLCTMGRLGECYRTAPSPLPVGWPVLIALSDSLVGGGSGPSLSLVAALISLPFLFLAGLLAGLPPIHALVPPTLLALLPLHVRYATTTSYEPVSILLLTIAMCGALVHGRWRRHMALSSACFAMALALAVSPAAAMALPAIAIAARPRLRDLVLVGLVLGTAIIPSYLSHELSWSGSSLGEMFVTTGEDVLRSLWFWWGTGHHTPLVTLLALSGAIALARQDRHTALAFLAWFLVTATAFTLHRIPLTDCNQDRHMLLAYPPLLVLAGAGVWWASERTKARPHWLLVVLVVASLPLLPEVFSTPGCPYGPLQEASFAPVAAAAIPDDCYVLTASPFFVNNAWGRRAMALQYEHAAQVMVARGDCVFLYENVFCRELSNLPTTGRTLPATCRRYHENFRLVPVRDSRLYKDPTSQARITLYKVRPRGSISATV
jgi:hypothetical protein